MHCVLGLSPLHVVAPATSTYGPAALMPLAGAACGGAGAGADRAGRLAAHELHGVLFARPGAPGLLCGGGPACARQGGPRARCGGWLGWQLGSCCQPAGHHPRPDSQLPALACCPQTSPPLRTPEPPQTCRCSSPRCCSRWRQRPRCAWWPIRAPSRRLGWCCRWPR